MAFKKKYFSSLKFISGRKWDQNTEGEAGSSGPPPPAGLRQRQRPEPRLPRGSAAPQSDVSQSVRPSVRPSGGFSPPVPAPLGPNHLPTAAAAAAAAPGLHLHRTRIRARPGGGDRLPRARGSGGSGGHREPRRRSSRGGRQGSSPLHDGRAGRAPDG